MIKIPPDDNQKGSYESHKHDAGDIISGTLDVNRLPTIPRSELEKPSMDYLGSVGMSASGFIKGGTTPFKEDGFYWVVVTSGTLRYKKIGYTTPLATINAGQGQLILMTSDYILENPDDANGVDFVVYKANI